MALVKISGNGPCPCGSGREYQTCCFNRAGSISNAFSAGSYGSWGEFHPGIAFAGIDRETVFVKEGTSYLGEAGAVANAETDLQLALDQSAGNKDRVVDNIQIAGYLPVQPAEHFEREQIDESANLDYAMNQLVVAYIQTNRPPETRIAFDRLIGLGYSRPQAFLMIKMVIMAEMWRSAGLRSSPEADRIVNALNGLPTLPDFMEAAGFHSVPVGSGISA